MLITISWILFKVLVYLCGGGVCVGVCVGVCARVRAPMCDV